MKSIFSTNLKKARLKKGWSQQGAAETIGIKRRLLGKYEEGRFEPSQKILQQICKAYEIDNLYKFMFDENYFGTFCTNNNLAA